MSLCRCHVLRQRRYGVCASQKRALGPTWEVFLEEAELCSEWGGTCVDLSQHQNLHDRGSPLFLTSPLAMPLHTHLQGVVTLLTPAGSYNSRFILPTPSSVLSAS